MKPKIVVSTQDLERLEALIDSMSASAAGKHELLSELARADILEPESMPATVVKMHSTVRFSMDATDEELTLTLVYPGEAGKMSNAISVLSPVGTALLGMAVGNCIEWPKPGGGTVNVRILQVDGHGAQADGART